jgi:4-carboxymuconolactone decarboxylase
LERETLDADQGRVADKIIEYAGGIGGPFNLMLRSAQLADLCFDLGAYLLMTSPLPRRLKEMAVLMRARFSNCDTEWAPHEARAREAGLDQAIIADLKLGRRPRTMNPDEAALYAFSAALLTRNAVDDKSLTAAVSAFGERGVADLTALIGFYGMVAGFVAVAELGTNGAAAPLEPVAAPFADETAR